MFQADELLLALLNANVRFVVIGGIAVGVHGYVRATKDLDIVPDPDFENLERLARLLSEIGAEHVGVDDFDTDEFPYDPTDPEQLAQGANFRLETVSGRWTSCSGSAVSKTRRIRPLPARRSRCRSAVWSCSCAALIIFAR